MLTLDLTNAPRWHDLAPGVRVQLRPLTTALMVATRSDPVIEAVSEEASDEERAVAFAKALARRAVLAWEGIGDADGNPIDPSPKAIDGGTVRTVPALAFAAAPRMHSGGTVGLRHDEVPAILQRGERVLSRREAKSYGAGGGVNVTIMARDAESFRQSRTQVAADIARAVSLGRRGM
jgi:hypothetical protein